MSNRRNTERQPSFLGGTIVYNRDRWTMPCVVKNLSRTGARISVRATNLPERFVLEVPSRKMAYSVRTRWRDGDTVGVEITGVVAVNARAEQRTEARLKGGRVKAEPADLGI